MTEHTSFHDLLPVKSGDIGGATVQTVNARDLHVALGVGRDFSTWIKTKLDRFGFVEGEDYVVTQDLRSPKPGSAKSREVVAIEYHLCLDTAKEIAMVDPSEKGREIRRYLIACEKMVRDLLGSGGVTPKVIGGIVKAVVHKELESAIRKRLPEMVSVAMAQDPRIAATEYVAVLDIAKRHKVPSKRRRQFCVAVGNQLARISASWEVPVKLSPESGKRLFSVSVADYWLGHGGRTYIADHMARLSGQGVLPFPTSKGRPRSEGDRP